MKRGFRFGQRVYTLRVGPPKWQSHLLIQRLVIRSSHQCYVVNYFSGLQGAITSIASPQNNFIASTSRDRFFRLHTAPPPPLTAGQQTEERGEVLGRLYTKSVSTSVVYAPVDATNDSDGIEEGGDEEDEDVWAGMKEADESDGEAEKGTKTKRAKK